MAKWYNSSTHSTRLDLTFKVGEIEYFFTHTVAMCSPQSIDSDSQPSAKQRKSEH